MNKVCFIANSEWYLSNFRHSTISEFSKIADVFCMAPKHNDNKCLNVPNVNVDYYHLDPSSTNLFREAYSFVLLLFKLLVHKPDIIYSFNPKINLYCLIIGWMLRIKCIPNVSGVGVASQLPGFKGKLYKALVRFFYRKATHVFFQNSNDRNNFISNKYVTAVNSEVIPGSGVDLNKFNFNGVARKKKFLMASRLIIQKGVLEYIEASKIVRNKHPNYEFYIAGVKDNSDRSIDHEIINEFNEEEGMYFLGHIKDMPLLLDQVDCVVLPSYYPEGVPRSLIEAASSGKAIITTDTPGCNEVVSDSVNGYLIPPCSVDSLADAMSRICELHDNSFFIMQHKSRDLAEKYFDEKIVINRYLAFCT